MGLRV
jgi:hypothetical protein